MDGKNKLELLKSCAVKSALGRKVRDVVEDTARSNLPDDKS